MTSDEIRTYVERRMPEFSDSDFGEINFRQSQVRLLGEIAAALAELNERNNKRDRAFWETLEEE